MKRNILKLSAAGNFIFALCAFSSSAKAECFRIDRAPNSEIFIERPTDLAGGKGSQSFLTLTNLQSLSTGLGRPLKTVKILIAVQNKDVRRQGAGFAVTNAMLIKYFGTGSRAIEAHWELSKGGKRVATSDPVFFRIGGSSKGLTGTQSGTIAFCQEGATTAA